jgi:hypothetical protein
MTFLLSEDAALKNYLQGLTVSDQKSTNDGRPRDVAVFYGQPDQEIRAQAYPYITIDMVDIRKDSEREHRGKVSPAYLAPENLGANKGWEIDFPIPVNIYYQITTYCRHPRHDRELLSQLLYSRLFLRFAQLSLDDGTNRRLEVLDVAKRDSTEQAKRLFVNSITVCISSEIAQGLLTELDKAHNGVAIAPIDVSTPQQFLP